MATKSVVFVHGLFQNPKSWAKWRAYFEAKGYNCQTPAYPYHEGEPSDLRKNIDPKLGTLTLGQVVDGIAKLIDTLPEKPIVIGHSMGGLIVQRLIGMDKAAAGVCIDTAPPKGISSFKWSFLKANLPTVNPLMGDSPCMPNVEWFHYAFCNLMTLEATRAEYDLFFLPESRNIPRSSTKADGYIDFKKPHHPLLFVAGGNDNIIPPSLNRKNYDAYLDPASKKDFKQFPGRTHYICGQENWEEVADYILDWIRPF
jgi:pimeloyl-ACP methyl ester carboxylesterase